MSRIQTLSSPMRALPLRALLAALLLAGAATASAEPGPHGPPGPPPAPSAEELATVPSLSTTQQVELRKILVERRNAHEAVESKTRDLMEAQRSKDRSDHERIDEQSSERVRKLLGDDGFKSYAEWQLAHRGPPGRGDGPGMRGPGGPGGPGGRGMERGGKPGERPDAPPAPPAVGALTPPAPGDVEAGS
jgi:hypothetical protein